MSDDTLQALLRRHSIPRDMWGAWRLLLGGRLPKRLTLQLRSVPRARACLADILLAQASRQSA